LSISYIYNLPKLSQPFWNWATGPNDSGQDTPAKTLPWFAHLLLDDWQVAGITIVQSGTPFSVINGGSSTISVLDNAGVANAVGAGSYPDVITHPVPIVATDNKKSFGPLLGNPNQFAAPRGLTFGNAGRNFLNNPRRTNFDLSFLKHFKVTEAGELEFRAEAFNLFNHTQFRTYNPDLGNTGSNTISCYGGPSYTAGFSAPNGTDCVTGSAFLHPVDAHRPRTIQFALKLSF
jgi:hypothetical protein